MALVEMGHNADGYWDLPVAWPIALAIDMNYYAYGWGSTTNATNNAGYLRQPNGDGWFHADYYAPGNTYMFDRGDSDVNMCAGDSGSPAVAGNGIGGIFSQYRHSSGHYCRDSSDYKEYWTIPGTKIAWIEARLPIAFNYACVGSSFCCKRLNSGQMAQCY